MRARPAKIVARGLWLLFGATLVTCKAAAPPDEDVGSARSPVFTNGGFEMGAANNPPQSWTVTDFLNSNGVIQASPETLADLQLAPGGKSLTTTIAAVNQPDPDLGATASLRVCRYGNQCARVNFHSSTTFGNGKNVNELAQTMTIGPGDVDPSDGQVHVRFAVAPVLENPAHPVAEQPYYFVQLTNVTQNTVLYTDFNLSAQPGVPWKTVNTGTPNEIDYTDWQLVDIAPGAAGIAMGDMVRLEVIASGCQPGGHFGEIYVDGVGSTVPGLFVSGTAAPQVNPCDDLTYTLNYHNGSAMNETGVVVDFTTPPQTTYQSINAPGLTCVTPLVGTAGTVTCTIGNLAAGASGSFQVTVAVACGATGTIVEGNYDIKSIQETALLGSHVITTIGCSLDTDCAVGMWCDESVNQCVPTLANGTQLPNDPPHMNPTLNGMCTAQAGALVCTSGVCDVDDKCGDANGDGPCTAMNGSVVCRSGVCDTDGKCGFLNGDGPCTPATGGTLCRSGVCDTDDLCGFADGDGPCTPATGGVLCRGGACSQNDLCEPLGGCNVDADCQVGNWCNEAMHLCTPQLANGQPIPNDPPHMGPALDGTCTQAAGTLVCASGVCDTNDNLCGYANGDGPCTPANGGTVCRSGMCSTSGVCEPNGGCEVDADCMATQYCDTPSSMCVDKVPNGQPVPTVPGHDPTLDGTCTADAGAAACASGVCDPTDNLCGLANGDGPCDMTDGSTVCRSGACSQDDTCEPMGGCNVDADCATGTWCNETTHMCVPTVANGMPVPSDPAHTSPTLDGTCTTDAGALTCTSGVCDTKDNDCGYANGDGPCDGTDGSVVCRSGKCSSTDMTDGTCVGCATNADCAQPTPVCDTTTGNCVQCTDSSQCSGMTPICDTTSEMCVPCKGDNGTSGPDTCPSKEPFCFLSGSMSGECGKCTMNSDCKGHMGNICDTMTGLCTNGCLEDSDCDTKKQWCNSDGTTPGMCVSKLDNGTPLPSMPSSVSTCTSDVGTRVCKSGACDPKDNECGLADGDGPCSDPSVCRSDKCDTTTMTCGPSKPPQCTKDSDCAPAGFCADDGQCTPLLNVGDTCARAGQCQSNDCSNNVCSSVVASGNGATCAATPSGDAGGGAVSLGLMFAALALARRRRGRSAVEW